MMVHPSTALWCDPTINSTDLPPCGCELAARIATRKLFRARLLDLIWQIGSEELPSILGVGAEPEYNWD
jgi:hypothetical protein